MNMEKGTSLWKDAWHRLAHNRAAIVSLFVLIVILLLCFIGPLMPFVKSPTVIDLANAAPLLHARAEGTRLGQLLASAALDATIERGRFDLARRPAPA